MRRPKILFLLAALLTSCSWGKRPDGAVSLDSAEEAARGIPGLELLADGGQLQPFLYEGQLYYEHERKVSDGAGHLLRTDRLVYDGLGRITNEWTPEIWFARLGINDYNDVLTRLIFSGEFDPLGRMVYLHRNILTDRGLLFYDLSRDTVEGVELFDLSAVRREAEENRHSFYIDPDLRERLERAGCFLPPNITFYLPSAVLFPRPEDYEGWESDPQVLKAFKRAANEAERSAVSLAKVLTSHLDSLQQEYEKVIERFVADNRLAAWRYGEYVLLPQKGFAFELTPGMTLSEDLPSIVARSLPPRDKKRTDVVLRRTGRKRRLQFTPIAFIPWWTWRSRDYYELTLDGKTWPVASTDRLQVLDVRKSDGVFCFSLIDPNGRARLIAFRPD